MKRKLQSTRIKYDPTLEELNSFQALQTAFQLPTFLYYFDPTRKLYIDLDILKKFGFTIIIYYLEGDLDEEVRIKV